MTVNDRTFETAEAQSSYLTDRHPGEAPLQAYVRRLHEQNNRLNPTDEPVRGRDPWNGIGL
jgi:hypothetical protein